MAAFLSELNEGQQVKAKGSDDGRIKGWSYLTVWGIPLLSLSRVEGTTGQRQRNGWVVAGCLAGPTLACPL